MAKKVLRPGFGRAKHPKAGQNIQRYFFAAFSPNSRATSVKAEPGSALESNIESNASASVKDKIISPRYQGAVRMSA